MILAFETYGHRFYTEDGNLIIPMYVQLTADSARAEWQRADLSWWEHLAGDVYRTLEFSTE